MKPVEPQTVRKKNRLILFLIALVFLAPMIVAGVLSFSGWQPGTKGNGQPVLPQRNLAIEKLQVRMDDGQLWAWRDSEPRLTLVALAGPDCASQCFKVLTGLAQTRVMLNRNQSRLRLLYLGVPPAGPQQLAAMDTYWSFGKDVDDKLASYRPTTPDSVSALLVESNGTLLSYYPAGFDGPGLLRDTQKVVR